ncbi:aminopeptidase P family protein [Carnobacteriaceae bacterium zg-ZUI252]|nr:aminopeptidase P family protein [Carnobacteriaceae bacterium zg-ZUI252]
MSKLFDFQNGLKDNHIPLTFVHNPQTIGYLTGFYSNPHERLLMLVLQDNEQPLLILPALDLEQAKQCTKNITLLPHLDSDNAWELLANALHHPQTTAALDKDYMSVSVFEKLQQALPNVTFSIDCSPIIEQIKYIKTEDELALMREAGKTADLAIQFAASAFDTKKSEMEIVAEIEYSLKKVGVSQMSFDTMVLRQPNAANPHGTPGTDTLQWNEFVLLDLGTIHNGYASDMTRTLFFGDAMSSRQKELYDLVLLAHHTARDQFRIGMKASELDKIARDIITDAGYGEYFTHRLGHGIGPSVHEFPSISSASDVALIEGMCFSIEPGIYLPNDIGIRIEDCFIVTKNGLESLTHSSYNPDYTTFL